MTKKMELFRRRIDEAMHGKDEALENLKKNIVLNGNMGIMQRDNVYIVYTKLKRLGNINFSKMFSSIYCENNSSNCYYVESLNIFNYKAEDSVLNGKFEIFVAHKTAPLKLDKDSDIVIFTEKKIDIFVVTDYGCFNILSRDINIDIMGAIYECFKKANIVLYPSYKSNFFEMYKECLTKFLDVNMVKKEKNTLNAKLEFIPEKGHVNKERDYVDIYINDMFFTTVPYDYTINAKFIIGNKKECQQVAFDSTISIFGLRTVIGVNFLINNLVNNLDQVLYEEDNGRQSYLFGRTGNIFDIKTDAYKVHKNITIARQHEIYDIVLDNFSDKVLSNDDFKLYVNENGNICNEKFLLDESDYTTFNSDDLYIYDQKIFVNEDNVYRQSTGLVKYQGDVYIISLKEILKQIYDLYYNQSFPIFGFCLFGMQLANVDFTDNFTGMYSLGFSQNQVEEDVIKKLICQYFDYTYFFCQDRICSMPKTAVKELYKKNMEFRKDKVSCISTHKDYYKNEENCHENKDFKESYIYMNNIKLRFFESKKSIKAHELIDSNSMIVYAPIKKGSIVHWFRKKLE